MLTSDFDYQLPASLVASHPADRRDRSRLMVVDRVNAQLHHREFAQLENLVPPGDALVLNDTRVFPARLVGKKPTGAAAQILLLHPVAGDPGGSWPELWHALVRPGTKLKPGRTVEVADRLRVEIVDSTGDGSRVVRLDSPLPVREALERYGKVPLPPYIQREVEPEDARRYQTVYARADGSVAAPTAGLHFTSGLLRRLQDKGVVVVRVRLHIGVGTFRPVEVADPAKHTMDSEFYSLSARAASTLNRVRGEGGSLWAVGTTVVRTLETAVDRSGVLHAGRGWTGLFIRPPHDFKAVDRLVTNFHLPRSTLLMLVAAFGGHHMVMRAYDEAVKRRYRFYSYGDAMVLI